MIVLISMSSIQPASHEEEGTDLGLVQQEGVEDARGVATSPAGSPEQDQSVQLAGNCSSHEDQRELSESSRSPPGGVSKSINKLIKSYKKSRNATKKINQIKNQIKNNKTKNAQIQSNTIVGHPEGEKRTLSQSVGPDGQYVLEEEEDGHVHNGLDDLQEHLELQHHIVRMNLWRRTSRV